MNILTQLADVCTACEAHIEHTGKPCPYHGECEVPNCHEVGKETGYGKFCVDHTDELDDFIRVQDKESEYMDHPDDFYQESSFCPSISFEQLYGV